MLCNVYDPSESCNCLFNPPIPTHPQRCLSCGAGGAQVEGQGGTCLCMLVELFDCLLLPAVQLPCHAMPAKLCSKWSLCLPPLSPSLPFFTCEQDAEAVDALHATAPELVAVYRQLLGQPDGVPGGCMRHACFTYAAAGAARRRAWWVAQSTRVVCRGSWVQRVCRKPRCCTWRLKRHPCCWSITSVSVPSRCLQPPRSCVCGWACDSSHSTALTPQACPHCAPSFFLPAAPEELRVRLGHCIRRLKQLWPAGCVVASLLHRCA